MTIKPVRWLFWAQAMTLTPNLILIRPERQYDAALIEHERTHARQMRSEGVLQFWCKYVFSRKFRLGAEVDAYRVQVAMNPNAHESCARTLASSYFLGLSVEQARELLS